MIPFLLLSSVVSCVMHSSLGYVEGNTVQLKGRVACEINTCDELIATEMVFENVLESLNPPEIAGSLPSRSNCPHAAALSWWISAFRRCLRRGAPPSYSAPLLQQAACGQTMSFRRMIPSLLTTQQPVFAFSTGRHVLWDRFCDVPSMLLTRRSHVFGVCA